MADKQDEVRQEVGEADEKYIEYHEAAEPTSLWPLAAVAGFAALMFSLYLFVPDQKHRDERVPYGKSFSAVGNIVDCLPTQQFGNGPYRSYVRTPDEKFFSVYWRRDFQPPLFGAAIGKLNYHECGIQDGTKVHCFDSFEISQQRVKVLDLGPEMPKK